MHRIEPARFKPGVTVEDLPQTLRPAETGGGRARDPRQGADLLGPEHPGKKRDAIDTDQITPAADCVSESLETLDERWKAGSFRYLMPDFRERVHRGETFLIAGDRFAIGSSREMSPAGLKGVAEEAGLELVVVCGANMGDIFRRNALNLGLHVVQSPEAVADARDGDDAHLRHADAPPDATKRSGRATSPSRSRRRRRRSGGAAASSRSDAGSSAVRRAGAADPLAGPGDRAAHDGDRADRLGAPRGQGRRRCGPGATLRVFADLLPASDGTAPFAIHTFNQITGGGTIFPRQAAIANDHFVFTGKDADEKQTSIGREFARRHGIGKPYYATPGDGIFHFYFPGAGSRPAGTVHPRRRFAQPRLRRVRRGRLRRRLDDARASAGRPATSTSRRRRQRRVVFRGRLQPWVSGKDIVLELLRRWGAKQSQGMSVEFVDADRQLPIAYRNTIANMMAEGEAQNGIFPRGRDHARVVPGEGNRGPSLPAPSRRARTRRTRSTRSSISRRSPR